MGKENSGKVTFVSSILSKIKRVVEEFAPLEIWTRILSVIFIKFLKGRIFGDCNWNKQDAMSDFCGRPKLLPGAVNELKMDFRIIILGLQLIFYNY